MPELFFKGKEYVYNHHLTVPYRPLLPDAKKSIGPADLGGNLIIHGDNLHALKSLLPRYAGKVDLVFIDPPYNTGNENWSYNDNVNSPIMQEWLRSNPVNAEDMLRHDKWLCMMWPRLTLLRELLSEHGSLWMTIDDNEIHRARGLFDEVFSEENFVGCFIWRKVDSPNDNKVSITPDHEFILCYAKDKQQASFSPMMAPGILDAYTAKDENERFYRDRLLKKNGKNSLRSDRPSMFFPIEDPDGKKSWPIHDNGEEACWAAGEKAVDRHRKDGTLIWKKREKLGKLVWEPYTREYAPEVPTRPYPTIWSDVPTMRQAKAMLRDIFSTTDVFDTPKPVELIERILALANIKDAIVFDSFAGSGTTAHAVLKANSIDGGARQFILVEGEDYADRITAERMRRVIKGYAWSGTQREELLREKVTWTQLQKAESLVAKVDAIKVKEGFAEEAAQMSLTDVPASRPASRKPGKGEKARRFDKIAVSVKDGELLVEGEKKISKRVEGLGGEFTYCTLGEPLDAEDILSGKTLPDYENLGAWLYYAATGGTLVRGKTRAKEYYLGEALDKHLWLIYKPDLKFLKSADAALTLSFARTLREKKPGKPHLVFAAAKFLSNRQLLEHGVEYAALPHSLYRGA